MSKANQLELFGGPCNETGTADPVKPAAVDRALRGLAGHLPSRLYLGTSSWSFPGWAGIVYERAYDARSLARHGLAAYAAHPLLRTISLDRSFYRPLTVEEYRGYAGWVPEHFRFLVKAPSALTTPFVGGRPNPHYLDPAHAMEQFVEPLLEGLREHHGPLVFQFPPQGGSTTRAPAQFADALYEFFRALPDGPRYAVELRDGALLGEDLIAALSTAGVGYCLSLHPRMPDVYDQMLINRQLAPAPLIVRWNLGHGLSYERARARYQPFDRLVEEDLPTRTSLVSAILRVLSEDQPVFVTINNKAEGCAPLSALRLAEQIARGLRRAAA